MIDANNSPDFVNPEGTVLERPDDPHHYRNFYTQHAPLYFRHLNENIRSLKLVPSGPCGFDKEYHGDEDPKFVSIEVCCFRIV